MSHLTAVVRWSMNLRRALPVAIRSLRARPLRTASTASEVVFGYPVMLLIRAINTSMPQTITRVS